MMIFVKRQDYGCALENLWNYKIEEINTRGWGIKLKVTLHNPEGGDLITRQ